MIIKQNAARMSACAFCAVIGAPVWANDPVETPIGGTFEYYGQLSPAYLAFDDGTETTKLIVDNSNSNSRIGMWYRRDARFGSVNVNVETAIGLRPSSKASQVFDPPVFDWNKTDIRKVEVIWQTDRLGTFYAGQGSMASDGVAIRDLSGTSIVSNVGISDTAGAFFLTTTTGALSTIPVASAFPSFDGGRRARVRYDSPSLRKFVFSVSVGEDVLSETPGTQDSDATVRYNHDGHHFRIDAAAGYTWIGRDRLENNRTSIGSVSVLHKASGVTFSASVGTRNTTGQYRFFKLGYDMNLFRIGPSSVSLDYYGGSHMVTGGSRSESFGFALIQKFANPRIEGYLALRNYAYTDETATEYRDARSVLIGTRWKF